MHNKEDELISIQDGSHGSGNREAQGLIGAHPGAVMSAEAWKGKLGARRARPPTIRSQFVPDRNITNARIGSLP